jgi:SAM-dependent methyltransferase
MSRDERVRWDDRYQNNKRWQVDHHPFPWLVQHTPPTQDGFALDVACGLGHNALWLVGQGYRVLGVDISLIALKRAVKAARSQSLDGRLVFALTDMDHFRPPSACFDLICVVRFLNRDVFPALISALKPGGILLYMTLNWHYAEVSPETPAAYLLSPGELERAFASMEIVEACEQEEMSFLAAHKPTG